MSPVDRLRCAAAVANAANAAKIAPETRPANATECEYCGVRDGLSAVL